ncbi:MAG TPA: MFS transporter [Gemmatimonadaceae bacterium]|nr:MFS transporter [Gemmatimonadaceae bacterium]
MITTDRVSETSLDRTTERDAPAASRLELLVSSSIGSVVEWYDFFVFASAAALVFDRVFFPTADPRNAVLYALMTYAVGFVTRPVGGLVFGVLGDLYGRKRALVWSLLLMGLVTMGVGLLPGYATIGVWAPVLLVVLRLIQGLAVGGEVGGALLLVAESLPAERRGYWSAWPMIGGPAGNVLSSAVLAVLAVWLGELAFGTWGWRIAFLASGALIGVGIWMRTRVSESPLYRAYAARRAGAPGQAIGPMLVSHWRSVLTVFLVKAAENALFYVFTTFYVVYVTRVLQRPRSLALEAGAIGSIVEVLAILAAGAWSDRIGRRPVTIFGLICAAAWTFMLFPATAGGSPAVVIAAAAIGGACHGIVVGGMSAFFVELFPTSARYTGFSLGYQVATVFTGALAPLIGVALLNAYGSTFPVSLYAAAMVVPGLVSLVVSRETRGSDLAAGQSR